MAREEAHRLLSDLDQDPELYGKMQEAANQVLEIARQHGYDVTDDDVRSALNEKHGSSIPMSDGTPAGDGGGSGSGGGGEGGGGGGGGGGGADPMTCFVASETPGR